MLIKKEKNIIFKFIQNPGSPPASPERGHARDGGQAESRITIDGGSNNRRQLVKFGGCYANNFSTSLTASSGLETY
jgi:hypothetical protein